MQVERKTTVHKVIITAYVAVVRLRMQEMEDGELLFSQWQALRLRYQLLVIVSKYYPSHWL